MHFKEIVDFTSESVWTMDVSAEIKTDLESLGIDAKIFSGSCGLAVEFKNDYDMNLYKISGQWKEDYYLMFVTDMAIFEKHE